MKAKANAGAVAAGSATASALAPRRPPVALPAATAPAFAFPPPRGVAPSTPVYDYIKPAAAQVYGDVKHSHASEAIYAEIPKPAAASARPPKSPAGDPRTWSVDDMAEFLSALQLSQ